MRLWGQVITSTPGNPAAGAEWSFVIPVGHIYTLMSMNYVLATSATAANRVSRITILDGSSNVVGIWGCNFTQVASQTLNYTLPSAVMGQQDPNGNFGLIGIPMPPLISLPGGFTLQSATRNLQVGDQYSATNFVFEDNAS